MRRRPSCRPRRPTAQAQQPSQRPGRGPGSARGPGNRDPTAEGASAISELTGDSPSGYSPAGVRRPADTALPVTEPPATAGQLRAPHSLGRSVQRLQDKEPVCKQTRGMSTRTGLTAGTAVYAATQRCICSHKAKKTKPPLTHTALVPHRGGRRQAGAQPPQLRPFPGLLKP